MRTTAIAVSTGLVIALVGLTSWLFRWSLEEAAVLAPVIVVTAGATAFIVVLWGKIVWESLRGARRPLALVGGILAAVALLVVLSFFVELPSYH
jgi:hypothetical protein